jgi:hypothetical protein
MLGNYTSTLNLTEERKKYLSYKKMTKKTHSTQRFYPGNPNGKTNIP